MLRLFTVAFRHHLGMERVGSSQSTEHLDLLKSKQQTTKVEEPEVQQKPTTEQAIGTIADAMKLSQAGVLDRKAQQMVAQIIKEVNASKGLPTDNQVKALDSIIDQFKSKLSGKLTEASDVGNVTKKFSVLGIGIGNRNFDTLIKDKKNLQGQIDKDIQELDKLKQQTPQGGKELTEHAGKIAALENQLEKNLAKLDKINTRIADKLGDGLTVTKYERYMKTEDHKAAIDGAVSGDEKLRDKLLNDKRTPTEVLGKILDQDQSLHTMMAIGRHPNASAEMLTKIAAGDDLNLKYLAANHANTPSDVLKQLAEVKDDEVQLAVAKNKNTPLEGLQKLATSKDPLVLDALVNHPNMTEDMLWKYAQLDHNQFSELQELALNKLPLNDVEFAGRVGDTILTRFLTLQSDNPNPRVREIVAGCQSTESYILEKLSKDSNFSVASAAQRSLSITAGPDARDITEGTLAERIQKARDLALELHLGDYMVRYDKSMDTLKELAQKLPDIKTPEGLKTCQTVFAKAKEQLEYATKLRGEGAGTGGSGLAAQQARKETKAILDQVSKLLDAQEKHVNALETARTSTSDSDLSELAGKNAQVDLEILKNPKATGYGAVLTLSNAYTLRTDPEGLAVKEALVRHSDTDDWAKFKLVAGLDTTTKELHMDEGVARAWTETNKANDVDHPDFPERFVKATANMEQLGKELKALQSLKPQTDEEKKDVQARLADLSGKMMQNYLEQNQALAQIHNGASGQPHVYSQFMPFYEHVNAQTRSLMESVAQQYTDLAQSMGQSDIKDLAGKSQSPGELAVLAWSKDSEVRLAVAGNQHATAQSLAGMATDTNSAVLQKVVTHPNRTTELLSSVLEHLTIGNIHERKFGKCEFSLKEMQPVVAAIAQDDLLLQEMRKTAKNLATDFGK